MKLNEQPQMSLESARVNAGLTQQELADLLGVNPKTISDWENKKVRIKPISLYGIAYVLKINADLLRV
ncbi:MAG: helix-turn-helix transcriptional regulator [Liquorilactobacillus ghanensis]|jgi:transcriptional regulator with XRE-family HTH domain|uniref:helix-turn-helix domain-containing protein n=1 Tax=Liquorilactobacillus ghanensis TaxID=399370 RepID=UPI0039E99675